MKVSVRIVNIFIVVIHFVFRRPVMKQQNVSHHLPTNQKMILSLFLPRTLDPWLGPLGRGQSGVRWFPLSLICSWPLKGSSADPANILPPWNMRHAHHFTEIHSSPVHFASQWFIRALLFVCSVVVTCCCSYSDLNYNNGTILPCLYSKDHWTPTWMEM